jgi:hypothetical protein
MEICFYNYKFEVSAYLWTKDNLPKEVTSIDAILLEEAVPIEIKEWFIHNLQLLQV